MITNLAVVVPGVDGGTVRREAALRARCDDVVPHQATAVAMSNLGALSDGNPANAQALNAVVSGSPARPVALEITKGADAARLAAARDVLLWVEYAETV